jgi:hypothetical protein
MTTVVSRLYDSVDTANGVADQLRAEGFPDRTISVITAADADEIARARVGERAASAYAKAMTGGQAVFVCRAPFTPFGAARRAMEVADSVPMVDAGIGKANEYIREEAQLDNLTPSVLGHHPLMMTRDDYVGSGWSGWRLSHVFGWPTVSARHERSPSVLQGTRYMSRMFWPGKLLSSKPRKSHVYSGGRLFLSSRNTVSTPKKHSVLRDHPRITEKLGFRTISERH